MELRKYFGIVWKWWWLVLLSVTIASVSSYIASKKATPLYRTKSTLMVGTAIQNPEASSSELYTGQQLANTYIQMVTREPVLKATVETLGWDINWEQLVPHIYANIVQQTQLIEIYAIYNDPLTAKVLADTVAQELIQLSPSGASQVNQDQMEFIKSQLADLTKKISSAQENLNSLNAKMDAADSASQIQDLQNQINAQEIKISAWQNTYAELLKTIQGGDVNALNVVEEAAIPTVPFSPNIRINVLLAAAIGLVLAVGGIFLIEYLDDTVRAVDDTQSLVNLPTLAKIGMINDKNHGSKLVTLEDPHSPEADSFRMLRMNLQSVGNWQSLKTILFTSAEPSVGKSVTVSNLAIVMAQFGLRVILVEADFRKPAIHKLFGIPNNTGLMDLMAKNELVVANCLSNTKIDRLKILTCGNTQVTTLEVLGADRMRTVINGLTSLADVVLFDSPPALMFTDPYLIGKLVNGVVIVSRAGRTRTELLKKVVEDLRMAGINLVGVVLQHRKSSEMYGYSYHHYYSEPEKEQKKSSIASMYQKKIETLAIELKKGKGD
jgi:capsular exopolysaccharide synthesis family protein